MKPIHPVANLLPMMPEDQFAGLVASVKATGLDLPIVLWNGQVIDGRARQAACVKAGIQPRYEERTFANDTEASAFVFRANVHRTHLKAEARFAAWLRAAESDPSLSVQMAEKRQECEGRMKAGKKATAGTSFDAWLGRTAGVSRSTAQRVTSLKRRSSRLFNQVANGELSAAKASRILTKVNRIVFRVAGTYDVILADPPWDYKGVSGDMGDATDINPRTHYPTADMDEIKGMDVQAVANKDAALFLWSPACFVHEAIQVAKAWGFSYRTGAIWHKQGTGFGGGIGWGGWLMVQHEHLLICTRGGCSPEAVNQMPSVFQAEVTKHSAKPDLVREWIGKMFPNARKLELFARNRPEGWTVWGDDPAL